MLFMPPLIQLLIFGYAANLDVNTARIAWMDQDHSPQSRELLAAFQGSGRFDIAATPASERRNAGPDWIAATWTAWSACCPDSRATSSAAGATSVQVLMDGTNSNTASHRFRLRSPDHRAIHQRK